MTLLFLTSINQAALITAEAQISANCGLPNIYGTNSWDSPPAKAVNEDLWFILKPPMEGWGNPDMHFTQAQMLANVDMTDIIEQEMDPDWFPPSDEI